MKNNVFSKFVLLISLCFFLVACTSRYSQENIFSSFSTHTALPALTDVPVGTPIHLVTPTQIEVTPVNTMTSEEQMNFVREFLSDNSNCRLPCWWNITPGQTWEDAEKTVRSLGGVLVPDIPGYDPEAIKYGTSINLKNVIPNGMISLEEKQELVHAWHISSTGGVKNPEEFRRVWKNYLAQKIVTVYEMPDRILLRADPSSTSLEYGLYSLWLFYDKLGFSILYEARIPRYFSDAPFFRICSETDPLLNIEINTQSPDNPLPLDRFDRTLEEVRLGTEIGKAIIVYSLQEATGLDETEIYDTFLQNDVACFAVPSDIWSVNR